MHMLESHYLYMMYMYIDPLLERYANERSLQGCPLAVPAAQQ